MVPAQRAEENIQKYQARMVPPLLEKAIDSLIENEESKEKYLVGKEEAASSYTYKKPKTGH